MVYACVVTVLNNILMHVIQLPFQYFRRWRCVETLSLASVQSRLRESANPLHWTEN